MPSNGPLTLQTWCKEAVILLIQQDPLPQNLVSWLYGTVRHRAQNSRRSETRRGKYEAQMVQFQQAWFCENHENQLDAKLASTALQKLLEVEREVIIARIWGGLTFEEIAEVTKTSVSTAHRRYQQGLAQLRERLNLTWLNKTTTPP